MNPSGLRGKERSFGRGLLLTIVTLGIYALYWHFKAYRELLDQYETREFPIVLYILYFVPLVNVVAAILFMSKFIGDLNTILGKLNMAPRITLGSFLFWYILGSFIIVGPFVAYHKLQGSINDVWRSTKPMAPARSQPQGAPMPAPPR